MTLTIEKHPYKEILSELYEMSRERSYIIIIYDQV